MSKLQKYLNIINESRDNDEMSVGDEVGKGDYVDFGPYGKLWVVRAGEDRLWVTDRKEDKNNPDAQGWYIRRSYAKKIIQSAYDDEDDDYNYDDYPKLTLKEIIEKVEKNSKGDKESDRAFEVISLAKENQISRREILPVIRQKYNLSSQEASELYDSI